MNYTNQYICGNDGGPMEVTNEATSGFRNPAAWLSDWASGGVKNDSGVSVNGYTALTHCPLWQGVNIIAGDLGQVPIRLVKGEFNDQKNHNAWQLLRVRPNDLQTPCLWMETMIQWALVWGNAVSWTPRVGSRITDLIPLRPDCLWPELIAFEEQQILLYHYHSPTNNKEYTFFPDEVIHLPGLGDGIWGYPLHQIAKNTIGHGLALEKHGNKQFSNGARPSGVLEHPTKLTPEAIANLRHDWNKIHQGTNNAGNIAILWEGMKFNATSMTNIDSQWIEAKKLNRVDCASLLNLPAHKLNALEDSSVRSNLEEQNETYKQMTLTRHANKLSQEFRRKLLTDKEWKSDDYQFVWDWDAFMKADIETQSAVADRLVKATILNPNEGRRMVGLPPREGGEVYGNPATSQQPEDGKESPDNGRPKNFAEKPTAMADSTSRMADVIHLENIALQHAAETERNFVAWLDAFYGRPKHAGKLADEFASAFKGSHASEIKSRRISGKFKTWCRERRLALLEICSSVTKDELASTVEKFTSESPTVVARGLVDGIFEE